MDDLDTELLRIALWAAFGAASLARPQPDGPDVGDPLRLSPAGRAARDADALLAIACLRWPDLAERPA